MTFNREAVQEDLRKVGIALMVAALVGSVLEDRVTWIGAVLGAALGAAMWVAGVRQPEE
jgi:hypothetical protein